MYTRHRTPCTTCVHSITTAHSSNIKQNVLHTFVQGFNVLFSVTITFYRNINVTQKQYIRVRSRSHLSNRNSNHHNNSSRNSSHHNNYHLQCTPEHTRTHCHL